MSDNIVSLTDQSDSQTVEMTVASSYLNEDVRLEKNEDNSQPFSHNLQNSLVADATSSAGLSGADVVDGSNMIFNQTAGVMYINAEGSVFKTKEAPSSSGILPITTSSRSESALCFEDSSNMNQNYLVVVENSGASQALSSDFGSSIVMNAESCEPNSDPSLTARRVQGLKSDDNLDNPHQHTIMVLDGQLGSEGILIDPDVLVAYENPSGEQMSFSANPALETSARSMPDLCQGPYIQLQEAPLADEMNYPSERSILPKSSLSQEGQSVHTVVIAPCIDDQNQKSKEFDLGKESINLNEVQQPSIDLIENSKLLQQKEELKMLEKYHLQHHMKEAKKKLVSQYETYGSQIVTSGKGKQPLGDSICLQESDDSTNLKSSVDDKTSVFSTITAKINADLLANVPGCQRFLFDKIKQSPLSSQLHMTFDSEVDCTFSGSLTSLIEVHNDLKKFLNIKDVSLLDWKVTENKEITRDQGIMCSLLQPFISSRGRQPKYSYKAKTMDFMSDFESLLSIDNAEDSDEKLSQVSSKKGKRKQRKPKKHLQKRKSHTIEKSYMNQIPLSHEEESSTPDCFPKSQSEIQDVNNTLPDLHDPLQQKLLQEQMKYRKRLQSSTSKAESFGLGADLDDDAVLSHATHDSDNEGQKNLEKESPDFSHITVTTRTRQCRPPKFFKQYEKVQPRNPLTESESTKQLRVYEENLAFKFFCKHCSFKSKRHSHFLIHMRCHKDGTKKTYSCKSCDFVTLSLSYLKRHELKHKENLFSCNICEAYQSDKEALLQRHIRMKHGSNSKAGVDGNLQCSQCSYQASSDKDLTKHMLAHSRLDGVGNKVVHSCPECKRTLRSKMHLYRHIRDVHGPDIRPHLCDKCGKAFKRTDALRQHKILHEAKANRSLPHKCTTCGKAFRSMAHLKEHLVIHTSERPYLCQYCGASFKTQAVQKRHILTLHIKPRAHVCSVCSRQFNTKHALQRHESTHVKTDNTQESSVMVANGLEGRHNAFDEKEKSIAISNLEAQVASISVGLKVEGDDNENNITTDAQVSSVLVQDMIGTTSSHSVMEDQMGQDNQRIQHTYIQGNQDATTLYYFAGDLHSL